MRKHLSKIDFLYLLPFIITLILCVLVQMTSSTTLAVVNMFVTAAGYETVIFIVKFFSPYRFAAFDLLKILISMILVYAVYVCQYYIVGAADGDMWPVLSAMMVISAVILVIVGPLVMLLKKRSEGD